MKQILIPLSVVAMLVAAVSLLNADRHGKDESRHVILQPEELEWKDGPPSVPPGSQIAVLEGDPSQEGLFTIRLKFPANYRLPPHTHPRTERVTIIEGELRLGTGREFDEQGTESLPAGSFFAMSPGMEHFVLTDEEVILQLNGVGPWEINYINPEDDPRRQQN